MSSDDLPTDWLRAVLPLVVLSRVAQGEETYGYAVVQALKADGLGAVKGATLYPILNRLEVEGHLESSWRAGDGGPGRKYVKLTDAGREHLATQAGAWRRFTEQTARLLPEPRSA